ncbi:MAG TPA: ferritin-like protein [Bryobacteraceae bacterium]
MIHLKAELLEDLKDSLPGLRRAVQNAIELELATLPPYLYALYSIKPGANLEIAGLIKSIVMQEMLHMALDCNILNAIDGHPVIDRPESVPKYPGPLPGAVESDLIVPLAPFSKQLVHDVFMVIEEPEDPLHFPVLKAAEIGAPQITIGQFYEAIKKQILKLSETQNIFTGDPARQLTTGFEVLQTLKITDAKSAIAAINLIVEQGEGTKTSPLDPEHELAHYYRYAEIFYGKKLIPNPDPKPGGPDYVYGGHAIVFNPAGVWPVVTNPSLSPYKPGTKAANLNDTFNYTYTSLLKSLHLTFNGQPDRLAPAIGLMESLKEQALVMMSYELVPGQTAGPSFQYRPVL